MWRTFFKSPIASSTRRRPIRRPSPPSRLCLETLEERCLLSFSLAASYPVGSNPSAIVTGHFRGAGQPLDLAVLNSGGVSVSLGNADGSFKQAQENNMGTGPVSLAVGDFNGDGKLDLLTVNTGNDVSVALAQGNGDGTFGPAATVASGLAPAPFGSGLASLPSVAAGDLNGDGKLDLVVTTSLLVITHGLYSNYYDYVNHANVLLGHGDATFDAPAQYNVGFDSDTPLSVAVGDIDRDGKLDVLIGHLIGDITLHLGNGDSTLQAQKFAGLGTNPISSLAVGDLNGDGKLDVVAAGNSGFGNNSVSVVLGNGDGTFLAAHHYAIDGNPNSVTLGDFNKDGNPDVVASNFGYVGTGPGVNVLLGDGDGIFQPAPVSITGYFYPTAIAVSDFNGDGFPDVAMASGSLNVLLNAADWSTTPANSFAISGFPSSIAAGVAGSFTVTTPTGYTGTVHFASTDGKALLPPEYTFTAADARVHTFSARLKTAGTQSISFNDSVTPAIRVTDSGITVKPAAAHQVVLTAPSSVDAGLAFSLTVTVKDTYGNDATGYTGTIHFSSSDSKAKLPANYTFTAADAGVHYFSVTLKKSGRQSITATDTQTATISGTVGRIYVNPGAATQFKLKAPASVTAGAAFKLTLTVKDAYGNVVTGYTGTIHFKSTDNTATLPANYVFKAADQGVHAFTGLVLRKKGTQKITLTDKRDGSLTGSVIENVL